ncbi:ABC transporter permease [Geobacter grbiciae]|uniref:ABC transporter permease n=1 Tax=Geobacter grbiciae TaxID=155042 RepID=UPI001C030D59|nr:ABC transporter permease subunit [Geobacter grbiciae]
MQPHTTDDNFRGKLTTPNAWDLAAFFLVMGIIALLAWGSREMALPYVPGKTVPSLSPDPWHLPYYALRTVIRMGAALGLSLAFTLTYATLAAKSRRLGPILVPALDILQSVPILGFLSVTVTGFISLFPGSLLGVEAASIFAIFTSQAWNMAFSFYQSLKTVPKDLGEAATIFGLSPWKRFWRVEAPFGVPPLIWNIMMSVSGGWFFVVASEAITVGKTSVTLPGIGSYMALAIHRQDLGAIGWALATMALVIFLYDQLFFRPLVAWAEKFRVELTESGAPPESWLLTIFTRTRLMGRLLRLVGTLPAQLAEHFPRPRRIRRQSGRSIRPEIQRTIDLAWNAIFALAALYGLWKLATFVSVIPLREVLSVFGLGLATLARVTVLLALASLLWVPVGVRIGLNPRWATRIQPVAQFLAAFPANLFFPVVVVLIVRFRLNPEIWTAPLMILGTQWYILFNVIAGASAIPNDLREAATNLGLSGWELWRRLLLPGIFPSLVTGLVTASGGTWNASIVAEMVSWGPTTLTATGLGSAIARWTERGDYPHIVLGIGVMSIFVVCLNRLFWRRLYLLAQTRYRLD